MRIVPLCFWPSRTKDDVPPQPPTSPSVPAEATTPAPGAPAPASTGPSPIDAAPPPAPECPAPAPARTPPTANPSTGSILAARGVHAVQVTDDTEGRKVGRIYLDSIREKGTPAESAFSTCVINATAPYLYNRSARNCDYAALQMLAAGITGPVSVALATLGTRALSGAYNHHDGRTMGYEILQGIQDNSTCATERQLAWVARNTAGKYMLEQDGFNVEKEAFQAIQQGAQGPAERVLGTVGSRAVRDASQSQYQRTIGLGFLQGIEKHATGNDARMLAHAAIEATNPYMYDSSAAKADMVALDMLAAGTSGPIERTLAEFGRRAQGGACNNTDARHIGHEVLQEINSHASTEAAKVLAHTALEATSPYMYDVSAARADMVAFDMMAEGLSGATDQVLARFGSRAESQACSHENARDMGYKVLAEIAAHASTTNHRVVAQTALKASGQYLHHDEAVKIQQDAYRAIMQG